MLYTATNYLAETFHSENLTNLCLHTIQAFDRDHGFKITDTNGKHVGNITRSGVLQVF